MSIRALAFAFALATFAVPATAEGARGKASQGAGVLRTLEVDTYYTEPPPTMDGFGCSPSALGAGRPEETCKMRLVGSATFTGSIDAAETYDMMVWFLPDGNMRYEGSATFDGTVVGCGTGTFVIDVPYGIIYNDRSDPFTQSVQGYNTWTLRKGSGTGDLERLVAGSGVNHWTEYPLQGHDGSDTFGYGHTTGEVTCRAPEDARTSARGRRR